MLVDSSIGNGTRIKQMRRIYTDNIRAHQFYLLHPCTILPTTNLDGCRKEERKRAPLSKDTLQKNLPAVRFYNALAKGKAQPKRILS